MSLLIEEVVKEVHKAQITTNAKGTKQEIFIYMKEHFYHRCISELKGRQGVTAFYTGRKIIGCPVFIVAEGPNGDQHAPYRVVTTEVEQESFALPKDLQRLTNFEEHGQQVINDLRETVRELEDRLRDIREYWNGDRNEQAMFDALAHIVEVASIN